jgi:hypothetical protein
MNNEEILSRTQRVILNLTIAKHLPHFRVSLNERIKQIQIAGKGHNETLEIFDPVEDTRVAIKSVDTHMSENGGTCLQRGK